MMMSSLALKPRGKIRKEWPGIHCLHMRSSAGFLGNLETTDILVRIAISMNTSCFVIDSQPLCLVVKVCRLVEAS